MNRDHELSIDFAACDGHGLCAELLPERITLDEWGYPVIRDSTVPGPLLTHAKRAVAACPVLALRLTRARGRDQQPQRSLHR
ncbi:ferredoxin [Actinacidiphila rubida]|uniref:Ferredoxin n=1 Tax=Actinacidiphila rubida TaxID=310780 RepID=A0A1H8SJ12_9ACTN|nr:ferredoxin [Actinacidiphila rubida]SEO78662.1 ferredoxin [Actinacidiphila rubida]